MTSYEELRFEARHAVVRFETTEGLTPQEYAALARTVTDAYVTSLVGDNAAHERADRWEEALERELGALRRALRSFGADPARIEPHLGMLAGLADAVRAKHVEAVLVVESLEGAMRTLKRMARKAACDETYNLRWRLTETAAAFHDVLVCGPLGPQVVGTRYDSPTSLSLRGDALAMHRVIELLSAAAESDESATARPSLNIVQRLVFERTRHLLRRASIPGGWVPRVIDGDGVRALTRLASACRLVAVAVA